MLRKVLVLLLILPLLQPKGFCLCGLVPFFLRATSQKSEASAADRKVVTVPSCSCRSANCPHRRARSLASSQTAAFSPTRSPGGNPDTRFPTGCPAHPSYAVTRAITTASAVSLAAMVFLSDLGQAQVSLADLDSLAPIAASHALSPPPSVPRFLLCRQFRC